MAKGRAYARYLFQEKHRRQYTFTKTKLIAGFFISVITSIFLGTYLEHFGPLILKQSFIAAQELVGVPAELQISESEPEATTQAPIPQKAADINSVEQRVENLVLVK